MYRHYSSDNHVDELKPIDKNLIYSVYAGRLVNIFYNNLHGSATSIRRSGQHGNDDLTTHYKTEIKYFLENIKNNNDYYTRYLRELQGYFYKYCSKKINSLEMCVNAIVYSMIPESNYIAMQAQQINMFFKSVNDSILQAYAIKILRPKKADDDTKTDFSLLQLVIDNRNDVSNHKLFHEYALRIVNLEKETQFAKFIVGDKKKSIS